MPNNLPQRHDLPFRLKRSAKRQFGALSLLKVESTVCFQRKRRRERAVTRERHDLPCSAFVPNLRRVAIQSHYINTQICSAAKRAIPHGY